MTALATSALVSVPFAFSLDELTDGAHGAGVQHVVWLEPASARGAHAKPHLPREGIGAVTVAVDGNRDPSRRGAAGERPVHVQVPGRTVDLQRRAGFDGGGEQLVEVEVV